MKTIILALTVIVAAGFLSDVKKDSLKAAYDGKFLVGVAVDRDQIHQRNENERKIINTEFNALTAENDMKWMHIPSKRGSLPLRAC